ncbi:MULTISPECIES: C13 family peptidase [unclassified Variovorax]|uniref:C13 family peptidase n=1 Tax=unclassified Variovorax TaxID=663243 RepID=UPI00210B9AFD|nr:MULTISPECIES: C13 family peptidase [unclassified Variovorax]
MTEEPSANSLADASLTMPPATPTVPMRAGILKWITEGLRSALLLAPRIGEAVPSPWQLLVIVLLPNLLLLAAERFEIKGPAVLNAPIAFNYLWTISALLWLGWWTLSGRAAAGVAGRLPRWLALASWAGIPASLLMVLLSIAFVRGWLPKPLTGVRGFWAVYGALLGWSVAAQMRLMARFATSRVRLALFAPGMAMILGLGLWQALEEQTHVWEADRSAASDEPEPARMRLDQETFEQQQALWQRAVDGLAERRPGHSNVYALVFAPYATEDVFLRESNMVTHLLEDRFDAKGRVLQLVNHATTTDTLPWATPLNLKRGIAALADRMDREEDVLVIYLTSHGASDHKLAASHWPLTVPWLTPEDLRKALDDAGVKHRVVAISACFSGGWIDAIASDETLVMTAADATHTSYGCGRLSELTFFGRAMFDEELRKTHSFEKAFAAAVPLIQRREIEAGKEDGFSNPQIRVGEKIRPVLEGLAKRLDGP